MASLTEFFNNEPNEKLKGVTHKNIAIKRNIIAYMAINGECSHSELRKPVCLYSSLGSLLTNTASA